MGVTQESAKQPDYFSHQIADAKRFHLDLRQSPKAPLTVVSGGFEHCSSNYEIHRKTFPYWGVEFVARGKGHLKLGGKKYDLLPGMLFAYGPDIPQDITSDPKETMVKYFVDFSGKESSPFLKRCGLNEGSVIQTSVPNEVALIFDELIRNAQRNTPYTARIALLLLEHILLKAVETSIPLGSSNTPGFATYRRIQKWIEEHYLEAQTLETIADECHINVSYLCRLFRRFDHQSPYHYLQRLKMNHAAQRLQAPDTSVKLVAEEMNFSDPFHFSRVFKKTIGVSPAQFVRFCHQH